MMTQPATGRAARLEDVAALAGVSTATASKALHNKPRISEETKQRVLDAAKQLNYSPNKLAQSLARGTTGTIGLVTSDLQGRFSTPILIGAENELRAQSTSVLLANARGDAALERQHVEKLLSLKVDGLLIVQCETNPRPTLGHDWGRATGLRLRPLHRPQRLLGHLRQRGRRPHGHQPSHLVWPPAHRHYRRRRNLYRCHRPHQGSSRGALRIRY